MSQRPHPADRRRPGWPPPALRLTFWIGFAALVAPPGAAAATAEGAGSVPLLGERPAVLRHLDQADIDAGRHTLQELRRAGQQLFDARFNLLDGRGRPGSTGSGAPRALGQPDFIRTSGPDANSCAGCHHQPRSGGAGDFVANVFVLAQTLDPVTESISGEFSNERNTLGMFGAGPIEMLAREMSRDLMAIREAARLAARKSGAAQTRDLVTKGVSFGRITVLPDGRVDPTAIEGVDWDLIVKPFHQKGAVVSLREFSNNAMNHHHGMQPAERFGHGVDADGDGVADELTVGDITALTLFQAALPAPRPATSPRASVRRAVRAGRALFREIGCGGCHRPTLVLESRAFTEPNPFNPAGNLVPEEVSEPFRFDLVRTSRSPLVRPLGNGRVAVHAMTDLKRHDLNDAELDHFGNERVAQGLLTGFADPAEFTVPPKPRPTGAFLTRKLWDAGDSAPYGHRGDLSTLTEAIWFHGGEARAARDAFVALTATEQSYVIEFLRSRVVGGARRGRE